MMKMMTMMTWWWLMMTMTLYIPGDDVVGVVLDWRPGGARTYDDRTPDGSNGRNTDDIPAADVTVRVVHQGRRRLDGRLSAVRLRRFPGVRGRQCAQSGMYKAVADSSEGVPMHQRRDGGQLDLFSQRFSKTVHKENKLAEKGWDRSEICLCRLSTAKLTSRFHLHF